MTGKTNKYGIYKVDHRTFGGELTLFDFEGHHTMVTMANKIMKDKAFDMQRKKDIDIRERNRTYGK